jgi:hypothetical protein
MNFNDAVVGGEGFAMDLEAVASEREIAGGELAGIVGGEGAVKLEGVTGEIDGGFEGEIIGAGDFEAELSGVALGADGKSEEQEAEVEQGAHDDGWGNPYAISFTGRTPVTKGMRGSDPFGFLQTVYIRLTKMA